MGSGWRQYWFSWLPAAHSALGMWIQDGCTATGINTSCFTFPRSLRKASIKITSVCFLHLRNLWIPYSDRKIFIFVNRNSLKVMSLILPSNICCNNLQYIYTRTTVTERSHIMNSHTYAHKPINAFIKC